MSTNRSHQNSAFAILRYQYFAAGRVLFLHDCMEMGALMLGYAIETSFKHGLLAAGVSDKKTLYSHNLEDLFSHPKSAAVFVNVEVAYDFITFANDLLDQRYPSQRHNRSLTMARDNRSIMLTPGMLIAYDDLLMQMDDAIWKFTNDYLSSIGLIAARSANMSISRTFFHCNAPALSRISSYLPLVKLHFPQNTPDIALLEQGIGALWQAEHVTLSFAPYEVLITLHPAANFVHPARERRDASGMIVLATSNFLRPPDNR